MGLDAQVIGIGPYSIEVVSALEYAETFYAEVEPGTVIVTNVFIACTLESSRKLASAFGVGAMELGKHKLNPNKAIAEELIDVFGEDNVAQFQCLARNGFEFYYLPNAQFNFIDNAVQPYGQGVAFGHWDAPPSGGAPITSTLCVVT